MAKRSGLLIVGWAVISVVLPLAGVAIAFYLDWPPSPPTVALTVLLVYTGLFRPSS